MNRQVKGDKKTCEVAMARSAQTFCVVSGPLPL